MIIDMRQIHGIYIVCGKTDLRRGIDGLANVVSQQYDLDPYSKSLFMFCGTRKDRFKALLWDGDGFLLLYKRIENGRLQWPRNMNEVKRLHSKQFERLLSGWSLESSIKQTTPPKNTRHQRQPVVKSCQHIKNGGGVHDDN